MYILLLVTFDNTRSVCHRGESKDLKVQSDHLLHCLLHKKRTASHKHKPQIYSRSLVFTSTKHCIFLNCRYDVIEYQKYINPHHLKMNHCHLMSLRNMQKIAVSINSHNPILTTCSECAAFLCTEHYENGVDRHLN